MQGRTSLGHLGFSCFQLHQRLDGINKMNMLTHLLVTNKKVVKEKPARSYDIQSIH